MVDLANGHKLSLVGDSALGLSVSDDSTYVPWDITGLVDYAGILAEGKPSTLSANNQLKLGLNLGTTINVNSYAIADTNQNTPLMGGGGMRQVWASRFYGYHTEDGEKAVFNLGVHKATLQLGYEPEYQTGTPGETKADSYSVSAGIDTNETEGYPYNHAYTGAAGLALFTAPAADSATFADLYPTRAGLLGRVKLVNHPVASSPVALSAMFQAGQAGEEIKNFDDAFVNLTIGVKDVPVGSGSLALYGYWAMLTGGSNDFGEDVSAKNVLGATVLLDVGPVQANVAVAHKWWDEGDDRHTTSYGGTGLTASVKYNHRDFTVGALGGFLKLKVAEDGYLSQELQNDTEGFMALAALVYLNAANTMALRGDVKGVFGSETQLGLNNYLTTSLGFTAAF